MTNDLENQLATIILEIATELKTKAATGQAGASLWFDPLDVREILELAEQLELPA